MGRHLDREYLEDYEEREKAQFERFVLEKFEKGTSDLESARYPPYERFVGIRKPVAITSLITAHEDNLWGQVPFCGSLVLTIPSLPQSLFEENFFEISEISQVINFIKETGRLQLVLQDSLKDFVGLDYMDPFFEELKPPLYFAAPLSIYGSEKELQVVANEFLTLGKVKYFDFLRRISQQTGIPPRGYRNIIERDLASYTILKLCHYTPMVEAIENSMIDDPQGAFTLSRLCKKFITLPSGELFADAMDYAMEEIREAQALPWVYRPQEVRLPCEIGKFLLSKLTYAPTGMRACNELIDHYDAYDLQKLLESMNSAIVADNPDIINKSASELSQVLDNVWKDEIIPKRVKGLKVGIPLSMAAIGGAAAGPIGAVGGLLAGLGYSVADKFIDLGTEGLSERLAKLKTKSYQVNIYDFKEKYKAQVAHS
jgi:hypothetical protein